MAYEGGYKGLHVDSLLTAFSIQYRPAPFIGDTICPRVPVKKATDKYAIYGKENLRWLSGLRADKTPSKEVKWTISSTAYDTNPYAFNSKVSQKDRDNADAPITPDMDAVALCSDMLDIDREKRIADLFRATGSYASSDHYVTLAGADRWDDAGDVSTPLDDIVDGCRQIYVATNRQPTHIIIPFDVALVLSRNAQYVEEVKYTKADLVERGGIPPILQGLKVVVAGSGYISTKKGQTEVLSSIWGTDVIILINEPNPTLKTVCWGKSMDWKGRVVRKWNEPGLNSDVVETEEQGLDEVITASGAAYMIQTVIS